MKRGSYVLVVFSVLVLCSISILSGCSKNEDKEVAVGEAKTEMETFEFKFSSGFGEMEAVNIYCKYLMDYVEEETGGRVTFKRFYSTLGTPFEQFGLVNTGAVDIAQVGQLMISNDLPIFGYNTSQPGSSEKALEYQNELNFENEESSKVLNSIMEEKNAVTLAFLPSGVDGLISKDVIHSLSDLKGKKVGSGKMYIEAFKEIGMDIVSIPPADMYESLSRGVVDAISFPVSVMVKLKLNEVAKSVLVSNTYGAGQTILFNKDSWTELPEDIKRVFKEGVESTIKYAVDFEKNDLKATYAKFKEGGVEVFEIPASETEMIFISNYEISMNEMEEKCIQLGLGEQAEVIREVSDRFTLK